MIFLGQRKRVVIGMSGGVDSSVAAALLKEEGYEVMGVNMQIWQSEQEEQEGCCSLPAVNDARKVAEKLEIPFYVMDFKELFQEKVVNYFTEEYLKGRTPNPCIACNRYIKFGSFYQKARDLKADYVATGHYATIRYDEEHKLYLLLRAEDRSKDQSYVLYTLTQEQLAHTLFPLGNFQKTEIRQKALDLGLIVADKPESQEICFIPNDDYKGFLIKQADKKIFSPGPFINTKGEIIGQHKGLPFYTVGQRKGLGLALGYPAYVLALDAKRNEVIIGREEEVYQRGLWAIDNNFIPFKTLDGPIDVQAKIRYAASPALARVFPEKTNRIKVLFNDPQRAITPGQAVVYYQGDLVLGGGIIDEVIF